MTFEPHLPPTILVPDALQLLNMLHALAAVLYDPPHALHEGARRLPIRPRHNDGDWDAVSIKP